MYVALIRRYTPPYGTHGARFRLRTNTQQPKFSQRSANGTQAMNSLSRREFLRSTGCALPAVAVLAGATPEQSRRPPNIVLILADDMGFSDLGCYGSEIATPNLDALAHGGIRFTRFSNFARCCPSRAALMTGLYPHQAGVGHMWYVPSRPMPTYQGYLNRRCMTIGEALRAGGYRTLMVGKWHLAGDHRRDHPERWPSARGFDRFYGFLGGTANYFRPNLTPNGILRQFLADDRHIDPGSTDYYTTNAFSDQAVKFIQEYGREDKPFFLYAAYNAPHFPLHALPQDIEKYRGKYLAGWDELRMRRHHRLLELGLFDRQLKLSPRDEQAPQWSAVKNKEHWDLKMAVYAAQVDCLDQGVGRILAALKETGNEDNTLVMFLSDNGGTAEHQDRSTGIPPGAMESFLAYDLPWANASNTPFRRYKHWVHEGGIATPFIARWPAVIKETDGISRFPGHVIDIMSTCLDAAGIKYPKRYEGHDLLPTEGESLVPVFKGTVQPRQKAVFWEHEGNRAVSQGKWKLVSYVSKQQGDKWELYDIEADRTELTDVADHQPHVVTELRSLYEHWAKRCGVLTRTELETIVNPERLAPRL